MIPLIVSGACGRTGKAVVLCACEAGGFEIKAALEAPGNPALGKTVSEALGASGCPTVIVSDKPQIDGKAVLVEFSSPEATMDHLKWAAENKLPVVIGTTALSAEQMKNVREAANKVPIVMASNMSVGMNLLFKLVEEAAKILGNDYDAEIFEIHHRFKKDSPSGSAKTLAERIAQARGADPKDVSICGRSGIVEERPSGEIGIHSMRAGDVVGEHTVVFATLGERLELTHRCHSRNTFALGALRAARFVYQKETGFYSMQDVLGIS
ncbi:4-hydroxy-tetrahydrodipicolinate reductase [Candidatus Sumerlaeota bacterium]|nr:4-hydroxy-tetrahydrodipicolinate reductase [Candidatus Sumerlaeota bacterium]